MPQPKPEGLSQVQDHKKNHLSVSAGVRRGKVRLSLPGADEGPLDHLPHGKR